MSRSIFASCFLFLVSLWVSPAANAEVSFYEGYKVSECASCYSESGFRSYVGTLARTYDGGTYVVFSKPNSLIYMFNVTKIVTWDGPDMIVRYKVQSMPVTTEIRQSFEHYLVVEGGAPVAKTFEIDVDFPFDGYVEFDATAQREINRFLLRERGWFYLFPPFYRGTISMVTTADGFVAVFVQNGSMGTVSQSLVLVLDEDGNVVATGPGVTPSSGGGTGGGYMLSFGGRTYNIKVRDGIVEVIPQ